MKTMPKRVRNLRKEQIEIEIEILERVDHLPAVNWESDLSKKDVRSLLQLPSLVAWHFLNFFDFQQVQYVQRII